MNRGSSPIMSMRIYYNNNSEILNFIDALQCLSRNGTSLLNKLKKNWLIKKGYYYFFLRPVLCVLLEKVLKFDGCKELS